VAELSALGKSWLWPFKPRKGSDAELAYWVDWLDVQQSIEMLWPGRLEGMPARHWPELTSLLALSSATLLEMLSHYGGPGKVKADGKAAGSADRPPSVLAPGSALGSVPTVALSSARAE